MSRRRVGPLTARDVVGNKVPHCGAARRATRTVQCDAHSGDVTRIRALLQPRAELSHGRAASHEEVNAGRVSPRRKKAAANSFLAVSDTTVFFTRRLRAFVKESGLDVKTSGPGRTKATIFADVVKKWDSGADTAPAAPAAPAPSPPPAAPAATVEDSVADPEPEPAEEEAEPMGAPPTGFEWGATF